MYIIKTDCGKKNGSEFFYGPFPSETRAQEYCNAFNRKWKWVILEIIVPNCINVEVNY